MVLKMIYRLVVITHFVIVLIISSIPFLFLVGGLNQLLQKLGLLTVIMTIVTNLILSFHCPLTLIQRKLETKLGSKKQVKSFLQELFLKIRIKISETFVKFLTIAFLSLDLVILVAVK